MIVYTTHNVPAAYIVAGRLESEGIAALVYQEPGASALGIHIGSLGEVKVLVNPHNYEQALSILEPELPDALPDAAGDVSYWLPDSDEEDDDD